MNDRYMEALEQYELSVDSVRKGRNGWICESSLGTVLLKEYRGTLKRLEFEKQVLGQVNEGKQVRVDDYIENKEGNLVSLGEDGTRYVLKHWFNDRECNLRDWREIVQTVRYIAGLHKSLRRIPVNEEWNLGSILVESKEREMERHNLELKRARNYMNNKKKKTELERCIMQSFPGFYKQAEEAWRGMCLLEKQDLRLCHGCLDHHHILLGNHGVAFIEFNKMHLGDQMTDLYHFMRKVMEKQDWDLELAEAMLGAYEGILPLEQHDKEVLYYLFLYPEKYWKQINFYYNAHKSWIPVRNMEKIQTLEKQSDVRQKFLELLRSK